MKDLAYACSHADVFTTRPCLRWQPYCATAKLATDLSNALPHYQHCVSGIDIQAKTNGSDAIDDDDEDDGDGIMMAEASSSITQVVSAFNTTNVREKTSAQGDGRSGRPQSDVPRHASKGKDSDRHSKSPGASKSPAVGNVMAAKATIEAKVRLISNRACTPVGKDDATRERRDEQEVRQQITLVRPVEGQTMTT
ncbi:hypothetical protein N0V90_013517 [Kalmusia sp. IMI 367209]|nr:hypothetical protein N0V90_013517 [Kalmusia sp. IMI 367209]